MTRPASEPADEATRRKHDIAGVFDRGAATYDQTGVDFFTPFGRELVARARLQPGERVLDLGCGRGAVLFAALAAVGPSGAVTGIDLAETMVALTRAEAAAHPNVTVEVGDAEDPGFPAASFDAILAGLVLFLLPDLAGALPRYAELLAPGGRLAFTTFGPSDRNFDAAMKALGGFVPDGMPDRSARQGRLRDVDSIAALLVENGFASVETTEVSHQSRFTDAAHWLAWAWSNGGRATLERVPAQSLAAATEAAFAAFEPARTERGDYAIDTPVRITVARP